MPQQIYRKLAKHLDNLPGGFPPSNTGVEFRILKRLFTPEEAEFALYLTLIPEESKVVARRAKLSTQDAAQRLETMAQKGLIYRIESEEGQPMYMASQYVIGIWEFEHSAPSVRTLKIFDITQVTTTKTLQFRHVVLGPG